MDQYCKFFKIIKKKHDSKTLHPTNYKNDETEKIGKGVFNTVNYNTWVTPRNRARPKRIRAQANTLDEDIKNLDLLQDY